MSCETLHLTTFGGLIDIPTSAEELMAELAAADVVIHDSLGPSVAELATLVPTRCELVPVGKRGGDGCLMR